jgi:hypothetical protein
MSDDHVPAPPGIWARFIAEDEARSRDFFRAAPRCDRCGNPIASRGRFRHYMCEPDTVVGHACTCPPGCSDTHYGNGLRDCDPLCRPCRLLNGQKLPGRKG